MNIRRAVLATLLGAASVANAQDTPAPRTLPHCEKPLATMMVGKIACKSANCDGGSAGRQNPLLALLSAAGQPNVSAIGDGIKDMFVTAIRSTNCVDLQEREALDEIAQELERAGKKLQVQQADFLVSGALTSVELSNNSTNIGWGLIPIIGSIGVNKQTATVSFDVRLVDINKARIVDSRKIDSTSENTSWGVGGVGVGTAHGVGIGFGGAFSSLKGTSLEAVSRDAVLSAAAFIVESLQRQQSAQVAPPVAVAQARSTTQPVPVPVAVTPSGIALAVDSPASPVPPETQP
jgi:curli biogenesis system outer membrane secretion channel CsgG